MKKFLSRTGILFLIMAALVFPACLPGKKMTVASVGSLVEEVAKASSRQSDLKLVREGTPAYLMLIDGMIEVWPDNDRLLLAGAQGYSSFASAFVEDKDKDYAKLLYGKAKRYGLRCIEKRGLRNPLQSPFDDFRERLKTLGEKDIPYLFWTATCWASWINLNLDSMEAMAELPRVESMMKRVLELDEGFYYGSAHLFMGIWYASRPKMAGGDLKKAQEHFLRALSLGQGKLLVGYLYYANYYARKAMDKDLFVSSLTRVIEAPPDIAPELTLVNTVAKEKARQLLDQTEDYFE